MVILVPVGVTSTQIATDTQRVKSLVLGLTAHVCCVSLWMMARHSDIAAVIVFFTRLFRHLSGIACTSCLCVHACVHLVGICQSVSLSMSECRCLNADV